MDDLEYLSMGSKENITKKDFPDELITSIMKDFCKCTNKGPPQTKIGVVKRLKGILSEIKKLNEKITPELSLNLIEYENLFNSELNTKRDDQTF